MLEPILAIVIGLIILIWSADRFIDGAAATAQYFGMPPLLIGIIIIGFGTSAPEIIVSTLSALNGNPGIALGNAYGSNITNIALILGLTALLSPITVHSQILKLDLPILSFVTLVSAYLLLDGSISRIEAFVLLIIFFTYVAWTIWQGVRNKDDALTTDVIEELNDHEAMSLGKAFFWILIGLALLVGSSQLLVWGAVEIAHYFGVSDLIIGLTIVAVGTSLPELASSIMAIKKGEHDLALGNIIGSNLFNTLAVVGLASAINPMSVGIEVFSRDMLVMGVLTLSLFVFGYGFKKQQGKINRLEGLLLLLTYIGYNFYLFKTAL